MSTDTRWVDSESSQNQGALKQPRRNGPSNNRLLHCSQMSVKEKQVVDRAKKCSHEVLQRGQTKEERKKNSVAFVTKVQIKRKAQCAWAANSCDHVEEAGEAIFRGESAELELLNSSSKDSCDSSVLHSCANDTQDKAEGIHAEVTEVSPSNVEDNAEELQGIIRCLSRRLRAPGVELRRYQSVKPLATFARPTKGELSLSEKGPVVLAPVLMSQHGRKYRGEIYDLDNSKDKTERNSRLIKQCGRGSSSAHENMTVQGTVVGHRGSRSVPEGVGLGFVDPHKHLCSCCRGSLLSEDSGKAVRRVQSAATERQRACIETKRNSTGKLVKISRNMQRSVPLINKAGTDTSAQSNISPCRGKGLLQHTLSIRLDLDSLSSRDYGSTPVPPSSPDQSDGEQSTDQSDGYTLLTNQMANTLMTNQMGTLDSPDQSDAKQSTDQSDWYTLLTNQLANSRLY